MSSKQYLKSTQCTASHTATQTSPGTIGQNELDTHADTCCAGANGKLMKLTNEVCDVSPFLNTYAPEKEIPVGQCCTVWTCNDTGHETLLVADQMLWFGSRWNTLLSTRIKSVSMACLSLTTHLTPTAMALMAMISLFHLTPRGQSCILSHMHRPSGKKNTCQFYF